MNTPEWMHRLWPKIKKAEAEINEWFGDYTDNFCISDEMNDLPANSPDSFKKFSYEEINESEENRAPSRCVENRDFDNLPGFYTDVYMIGNYSIFRVENNILKKLNEGYEDTSGTENERFVKDGDYTIVIYMC